jgi:uncharacterized membrane protein YdjX (TVP38/TMEM64 family)
MTDTPTPDPKKSSKNKGLSRYIPVVVIAVVFGSIVVLGGQDYLTFEAFQANRTFLVGLVDSFGVLAPLLFIFVYAAMIVLVPPSGTVMTLISGFLFGTWLGGTVNVVAATIGATALFLATRTAFGDVLRARAGGAVAKMEAGFRENAVSYMLFLRLVPVFPFFVVNIVPALLGVPLRVFAATTALGIIPGTFIYTSLGAGLGSILEEESPNFGLIFEPRYLGPILGLAALSLLPILLKRRRGKADVS